ncbi:hypothetical protein HPB51_013247 [Rhipicephalus microplus]|uniref:Uncharacterized protein n=1 Tax=Rhipicephalus microplus TaxID=6941 RepID=A0A9J6F437_RHIMP|nr:hypothetical protein HPB51_013247 [Rhipicephalus microplus]
MEAYIDRATFMMTNGVCQVSKKQIRRFMRNVDKVEMSEADLEALTTKFQHQGFDPVGTAAKVLEQKAIKKVPPSKDDGPPPASQTSRDACHQPRLPPGLMTQTFATAIPINKSCTVNLVYTHCLYLVEFIKIITPKMRHQGESVILESCLLALKAALSKRDSESHDRNVALLIDVGALWRSEPFGPEKNELIDRLLNKDSALAALNKEIPDALDSEEFDDEVVGAPDYHDKITIKAIRRLGSLINARTLDGFVVLEPTTQFTRVRVVDPATPWEPSLGHNLPQLHRMQ